MAIAKNSKKWGKFTRETHGVSFIGEELVDLMIPFEEQNPVNHHIVCINGNQIILGVDENLKVPKSVYDNFIKSRRETNIAKKNMAHMVEIKA